MECRLKIRFWNINGLSEEKMSDEAFKREINMTFYFCVRHGYAGKTNNFSHPNRYLCNFVFRNINKVISLFDKSNENILWIKIGKIP